MTLDRQIPLEELEELEIPDEQVGRQAVDALRGYVYQVYQSLLSWIRLTEDEVLLLEVAEDFAVCAKGALTATQVKATGGSVTLRSESVAAAIRALWDFQEANPAMTVRVNYLTTSTIGKERGLRFPEGRAGLSYWRVAAREGMDVEPIRKVLVTLSLPPNIKGFIKEAEADELRAKILRRIQWICGAAEIEVLAKTILDRLVCVGEKQSLTPTDCERARDVLVAEILRTIVKKEERRLNKAGFLRVLEKASTVSMPVSTLRNVMGVMSGIVGQQAGDLAAGTGAVVRVSAIPLPPRLVGRDVLVTRLVTEIGQAGTMWLHGSSGVGKTVLAQLVARRSDREWLLVQLRHCTDHEVEYRLDRVLDEVSHRDVGGVVLDDFPTGHAHAARVRVSMLANEVQRVDGVILITASKPLPPSLRNCLGGERCVDCEVPYLTQDEVCEVVRKAGGDPRIWGGVIHAFCGAGHPQLVQARISGLQDRNWPTQELLADIDPSRGFSQEVESERESTRDRLIAELSDSARELLCRLTLVLGRFDRALAVSLGCLEPLIGRPGEVLGMLVGPWIERRAADRFVVSPLVTDAGVKSLSREMQSKVHEAVIDQLIGRHPFPGDFLRQLLVHALGSKHERGLAWLAMAVLNAPLEHRTMMSEELFVLPLLGIDKGSILVEKNTHVSALLRMAQFNVAIWSNRVDLLSAISERFIDEVRAIDNEGVRAALLPMAVVGVLMEKAVPISPSRWMALLGELEKILADDGEFARLVRTRDLLEDPRIDLPLPGFLFALRATAMKSIDELAELFSQLSDMEPGRRKELLSALHQIPSGKRLMIDSAWMAEARQADMDAVGAAEKYAKLADTAESWAEDSIAVECECARVVLLDEYGHDSDSALAVLDEAGKRHPNNVRLARARAHVYYREGDHRKALETIGEVAHLIPEDDSVGRAFSLRQAGISAAKVELFPQARDFFRQACEAAGAGTENMRTIAVGLKGDWAWAEFQLGNKAEAIDLMRQALSEAERMDPEAGKREKYCRLVLGHMALWMQAKVRGGRVPEPNVPLFPGCCSNPEPPDEVLNLPSQPFLAYWYQLAMVEVMLGMEAGILRHLRTLTRGQKILTCEFVLNYELMARHVVSVDIGKFFSYLPEYTVMAVGMRKQGRSGQPTGSFDLTAGESPFVQPTDWKDGDCLWVARDATVALMACALCSQVCDFEEAVRGYISPNETLKGALGPLIEGGDERVGIDGVHEVAARCLTRLMQKDYIRPDELFVVCCRLWEWLHRSDFKAYLEDPVAEYLVDRWREILANQRFNLLRPSVTVPIIQSSLDGPTTGLEKIANVILAAEDAVEPKLSPEFSQRLKG